MRTILIRVGAACALLALSASALATVVAVGGGGGSTSTSTVDCTNAYASVTEIWPPDHAYVPVIVLGVTDSSGAAIQVLSTGIEQDEPVAAPGSGHTSPDATGVGTPTAMVRAERAGPGTGRLYFISFSATEVGGTASCTGGPLRVWVPHDQGQGFVPVDTGVRYDSTAASL